MRVLLLGATGAEPSFQAWRAGLDRAGVPFEAIALGVERSPVRLVDGAGHARFQALILATSAVLDDALSRSEREALEELEREFGIRRLTAYAYPGPAHGLRAPLWAGPLEGVSASLTPSGHRLFPYLRGALPIEAGNWGYLSVPAWAADFETLVAAADGAALIGIHRHGDGREEMVQTFDANAGQTHGELLRHGQLAWVTRGSYLGYERNYLSLQIDDVLLPNHAWNVVTHGPDVSPGAIIRMTPDDAARAARWSHARGLRLDLVCNGGGSGRYMREAGVPADPLLGALLAERDAFGWINHTYEHGNLDRVPRSQIEAEIQRNFSWAHQLGIELEPDVVVTGEHTGLANLAATPPQGENPQLAAALAAQAIRYVACDASRSYPARRQDPAGPRLPPGTPFMVGPALAVPRYPTLLASDAATEAQALDRLRCGGLAGELSWEDVVGSEARRVFALVTSNDPRPHYFHQSNLVGGPGDPQDGPGGVFYMLIDAVLDLYRRHVAPAAPIVQPTLREIGEQLFRWTAWRRALAAGSIMGYVGDSRVTIVNNAGTALDIPMSGTEAGSEYGGMRSGWVRVAPGETVFNCSASRIDAPK